MATLADATGRPCSERVISLPHPEEDAPLLLAEAARPRTTKASPNRRSAQPIAAAGLAALGAVAVILVVLIGPHSGEALYQDHLSLDSTPMGVSQIRQLAIRNPACKMAQGRQQRDHEKKLKKRHGALAKHCPAEIVSDTRPNCSAPGATTECEAACRSVASFESDKKAACVESGERCTFDYRGPRGEDHWEDVEKETRDSFHSVKQQCGEDKCSVMLRCGH